MNQAVALKRLEVKAAREARAFEREKILYDRVLTPNMIRLLLIMAIISYSTWCARSKKNVGPVQSALAFALPGIGIPVIAADAGITDKYALAAISAVGLTYTGLQSAQGWSDAGILGDVPIVGPIGVNDIKKFLADLGTAPAGSMQALISAVNPFD